MVGFDMGLELVLVGLLAGTLLQAVRLQRALGALRRDRAALDVAAAGFDGGAREMEGGLARLREAAERMQVQVEQAGSVRDDLAYLSDRGEGLADRLDVLVRAARGAAEPVAAGAPLPAMRQADAGRDADRTIGMEATSVAALRSQAERSLLLALQARR